MSDAIHLTPITELQHMVDGQQLVATGGIIKAVGQRFGGNGVDGKPYSFQDLLIHDGAGHEYPVTFADRPEVLKNVIGKTVQFVSKKHETTGSFSGVKIKNRKDRNKQLRPVLWITPSASVIGIEGNYGEAPAPVAQAAPIPAPVAQPAPVVAPKPVPAPVAATVAAPAPQSAPVRQPSPATVAEPNQTHSEPGSQKLDSVERVIQLRRYFAQRGNAMSMAADEALRVVEDFSLRHKLPWDDGVKAGVCAILGRQMTETLFSTLFISADRGKNTRDTYILDDMPSSDLSELLAAAKDRVQQRKLARG